MKWWMIANLVVNAVRFVIDALKQSGLINGDAAPIVQKSVALALDPDTPETDVVEVAKKIAPETLV